MTFSSSLNGPITFSIFFLASLLAESAEAQTTLHTKAEDLRINTVYIEGFDASTATSAGYGFIFAQLGQELFVAVPNHVVRKASQDSGDEIVPFDSYIVKFFSSSPPSVSTTLHEEFDLDYDFAVLKVNVTGRIPWLRQSLAAKSDLRRLEPVLPIGADGQWLIPVNNGAIADTCNLLCIILAQNLQIPAGTSGAPMITKSGIIGLTGQSTGQTDTRALSMNSIRAFADDWQLPWHLTTEVDWAVLEARFKDATAAGETTVLDEIIATGFDFTQLQFSPLALALENDQDEAINFFLNAGDWSFRSVDNRLNGMVRSLTEDLLLAKIDFDQETMERAIASGNLGLTKVIASEMQSPLVPENLDLAIEQGHAEIAKFLVAEGAAPQDAVPLLRALSNQIDQDLTNVLVDATPVNSQGFYSGGDTPLHSAAETGNLEALRKLIKLGWDLDAESGSNDLTALLYAVKEKKIEAVKILVNAGADITAGDTTYYALTRFPHPEIDLILLNAPDACLNLSLGLAAGAISLESRVEIDRLRSSGKLDWC